MKNQTNQSRSSVLAKLLRCAFAILCAPLLLLSAHAAFSTVDTFEGLVLGNLDTQNGWTVQNTTGIVTNDPASPAHNKVMAVTGTTLNAFKAVTLSQGTTGTLFFRFRWTGPKNMSIGMSDLATPTVPSNFGDYEPQLNMNTAANTLNARHAGAFLGVTNLTSDTWYNCWVVIDNAADNMAVYMTTAERNATEGDRLVYGTTNLFTFRNGVAANDLLIFLVKTGAGTSPTESQTGNLYLDDVLFDASGANLQFAVVPETPVAAAQKRDGAVQLNWAAVPRAESYNVKRSTTPGGPYTTITNTAEISLLDSGLANGTTYYYVVSGVNTNGEGFASVQASATPNAAVTSLTAVWTNATIELTWPEVASALNYNVYRGYTAGGPYVALTTTNATTNFVDLTFTNGVTYYYIVSANFASGEGVNSPEASAQTPPAITVQPVSQSLPDGGTIALSVTAVGTGTLTYQWTQDGTNVTGANSDSLTINNAATNHSGAYTVVIANGIGSVTSEVATVAVLLTPVIITQPTATYFFREGDLNAITIQVRGLTPLAITWQKFDGADWQTVTSQAGVSNAFALFSWVGADSGDYRAVVTNDLGAATSSVAAVTVVLPVVITNQPISQVRTSGNSVTFSVEASGNLLAYQWRFNNNNIADATNSSYTIASVALANEGNFDVVVNNQFFSATSSVAALDVKYTPVISPQPTSRTVILGGATTFTSGATGDPAPSFQWQLNGIDIPGATEASLTIDPVQMPQVGSYTVVAYNNVGAATSSVATLRVSYPAPALAYDFNTPANFSANFFTNAFNYNNVTSGGVGNSGSLDLPNNGDGTAIYKPMSFDFSQPGKVLGASMMVKFKQATAVQRILHLGFTTKTNADGRFNDSVDSQWMTIRWNSTVANNPEAQLQWQGRAVTGTGSAIQNGYVGPINRAVGGRWYKVVGWFENLGGGSFKVWGEVWDYGTDGLTPTALCNYYPAQIASNPLITTNSTLYVAFRGNNDTGTDNLDDLAVYVGYRPLPLINVPPASQTVAVGQAATFSVAANTSLLANPAVQWYANGAAIPGATNVLYKTPYLNTAADGTMYHVVVANDFGAVTSSVARLTVTGTDTAAPTLVSAGSVNPAVVGVAFSEALDPVTAQNPANYTVAGALVGKATLQSDGKSVRLDLAGQVSTASFQVDVRNVQDVSGNTMVDASVNGALWGQEFSRFTVGFPFVQGEADFSIAQGAVEMHAGGGDLYSSPDSGFLMVSPRTGDFDVRVRVEELIRPLQTMFASPQGGDDYMKFALMAREGLSPSPRMVHIAAAPPATSQFIVGGNRFESDQRTAYGAGGNNLNSSTANIPAYPNAWLRLRRVGDTYITYFGTNGTTWTQHASTVHAGLNDTLYVGLAGTVHMNANWYMKKGIGKFRDFGDFAYPDAGVAITTDLNAAYAANEGSTAALQISASVSGSVPLNEVQYLWQRAAAGGQWLNISNVNALTTSNYTTVALKKWLDDGSQYRVIVKVPGASITSQVATVTVNAEANLPTITSAISYPGMNTTIVVKFSEAVSSETATNLAGYYVTNSLGEANLVTGAAFFGDAATVVLTMQNPLTTGLNYVVVNGVADLSGNAIAANSLASFDLKDGTANPVMWEVYLGMPNFGGRPADLPQVRKFASAQYDSIVITNHAGFNTNNSNSGVDNFALKVRFYYVPPVSGSYRFFLRSDDGSRLYINTNSVASDDAAGATFQAGSTGSNADYGISVYSRSTAYITMNAGQKYYVEFWLAEGGGNDYFALYASTSTSGTAPVRGLIIPAGEMAPVTGPVEVAGISVLDASLNDWSKPVTLKAFGVKGMGPYCIQWYKNGQPIENANDYSVVAAPENGAVYKFVISNLFSRAEAAYTLTLANDATQLAVVGVTPSPRFDGVTLTFNKPVDLATAYNQANYQLTGLDFLGITVRSDRTNVFLATSLQAESGNYSVMVSGVKDAGAEPTTIAATNLAFQANFLVQGYIRTEHYNETVSYLVQGTPANGLFVNQKFLDEKPDKTAVSANFYYTSSPAQDLYGARMYGWFVPPASGNWTFYERADDGSILYLNPMGTDPAGKVVVARSEAAGQNYTNVNTGNPRYSAVTLAAGSRYYIEGVFQEGTGGDFMSAAVRAPSDLSVPLDGEYARGDFFMMSVPAERRTDIYVLRNPVGGNIQEGQTFTLNGLASAFDLSLATTYIWQQETAYGSGVFTNLTDASGNFYAIGTNYTTPQLYGVNTTNRYRVAVYSPSGKAYSAVAEVAVIAPDTTPPAILGAVSPLARTSVTVMFSEMVSAATANVLANYRLTDGVTDLPISGVALQADNRSVVLTLGTTLMPGNPYTVVVNNVQDTAVTQNMIAADAAYQFWAPQGFFMRKAYGYASGLPGSISALTNDARWINDQYTFIHAITTPDVPNSSPDTNNFASRFQGYLIPDRTGNFTFYIATDDNGELWLSTDNNPANAQLLCLEQGHANGVRNWVGAGSSRTINPDTGDYYNVSRTLFLQAGKAYFFELKHREGSGGDYQGFNWKGPGEAIPVNGSVSRITAPNLISMTPDALASVSPLPAVVQTNELATVRFAPVIAGYPNLAIQWRSNGVAIAGATSAVFTTPVLTYPAFTNVVYDVVVSSLYNTVTSTPAMIELVLDTVAPAIASGQGGYRGTPSFLVSFNEPVASASAADAANYTVTNASGTLPVTAATLLGNNQQVVLTLGAAPVEGAAYTITVSNIADRASLANVTAEAVVSVTAWVFTTNFAYFEVFTNLTGGTLPDLTNAAAYRNNQPSFTGYTNRANYGSSQTTPLFENYGLALRSYFLAPAFDDYAFFLAHDDAALLRLTTDGSAGTIATVIEQAGTSGFTNGLNSYTNAGMFAGPRYFFEVLGKEGTGGDYFRVAAVPAAQAQEPLTDPLFFANLQPLSAGQLGVYAPPATVTITQQPTNTTILQNRAATFAVAADVLPAGVASYAAYQWRSNGVDIPGANGRTYTTAVQPSVGATATYSVAVSAPGAAPVVSDGALLTVEADTAAPKFVFAGSVDGRTIEVQFDELVDPVTASDPTLYYLNYTSDPDPYSPNNWLNDVNSAVLRPDGRTVSLTLAQALNQRTFMVQVNFVKDLTLDENNGTLAEVIAGVNLGFRSEDMGLLTGTMVGASSNYLSAANGITIMSDGADIWGAADGGNFLYREVAGNFDISAQIAGLWRADFWTKAGLMARVSVANTSYNFTMLATPNPTEGLTAQNTYTTQWRDPAYPGSRGTGDEGKVRPALQPYPDNWVRLKRVGNDMMSAYSTNGVDWIWDWTNRTVAAQSATGKLLVGLATTSHTTATQTVADYRNLYFPLPPTITVEPSPVTITVALHGSVTMSGAATNPANSGALVYSWRKNGQVLAGATDSTLTLTNLGTADSGVYILAAGNDGGEAWSVPVQLTVANQVPVLGADLVSTAPGTAVQLPVSSLLANDTDPDGDGLTLVGIFRQPSLLFYDFNNGLPQNTTIANNALVDVAGGFNGSGVLKVTPAAGSMSGIFVIDDPVLTNLVVNEFTLDCKLFIGAGSATPADGMAFAFGADITTNTPVGAAEDGIGSGLSVCIDNYNSGNNEAPAIDIKYGTNYNVRIPIATIRQTAYVDFHVRLDPDGTLDVAYAGNVIVSNLPTPFVPQVGRFAIAARTGGSYEAHWVDDLRITVDSLTTPRGGNLVVADGTITYTPAAGVCGQDTFYYVVTDGQPDGQIIQPVTVNITETNAVAPSFAVGLTNQILPADTNYQAALPDLRDQVLATDNCSVVSLTQTPAPGALLPLGDTTVTLIAADGLGLTATNSAVITVVPSTAPTITAQPTNVAIALGGTATFSVTANGGLPVTYQWLLNGTNLDGATSATLVITNAQVANAGTYSVAVSNSFDGLISDAVVLTVITTPPTVGSPLFGAGAFSVKVDSIIGRTYVLQYTEEFKLNMAETVWTDLPGVAGTGAEITLTDPAATAPRRYYRIAVQ